MSDVDCLIKLARKAQAEKAKEDRARRHVHGPYDARLVGSTRTFGIQFWRSRRWGRTRKDVRFMTVQYGIEWLQKMGYVCREIVHEDGKVDVL